MDSKHITFDVLSAMPENNEFKGSELMRTVCSKAGVMHYPDTLLRYMREWRKKHPDFNIVLVSKPKSIYRKVKRA